MEVRYIIPADGKMMISKVYMKKAGKAHIKRSYRRNILIPFRKEVGLDRFAYSNEGPLEHNMRIEMGKRIADTT